MFDSRCWKKQDAHDTRLRLETRGAGVLKAGSRAHLTEKSCRASNSDGDIAKSSGKRQFSGQSDVSYCRLGGKRARCALSLNSVVLPEAGTPKAKRPVVTVNLCRSVDYPANGGMVFSSLNVCRPTNDSFILPDGGRLVNLPVLSPWISAAKRHARKNPREH
jgi:hypothetical protein